MTELQRAILRLLRDLAGAHTIDQLAGWFVVPRRDVEEALEGLRLAGEPVLAGAGGVWLSDDPDEVRAYVRSRRRRELSIAKVTRALGHAAIRLERGDMSLGLTA